MVVPEQLHDEGCVLVALLLQVVQVCHCILKGSLRHVAGLVWGSKDLIIEHREVECQSKSDWVCGTQVLLGYLTCTLVGLQRFLS